jgi:hypothetical protein
MEQAAAGTAKPATARKWHTYAEPGNEKEVINFAHYLNRVRLLLTCVTERIHSLERDHENLKGQFRIFLARLSY